MFNNIPRFLFGENILKVTVTYNDFSSLTVLEVEENMKARFGVTSEVKVEPLDNSTDSLVYFAIQQLITREQACLFFDEEELYNIKLVELKKHALNVLGDICDRVIKDNELKFTGD
jgi:hypothetical protein